MNEPIDYTTNDWKQAVEPHVHYALFHAWIRSVRIEYEKYRNGSSASAEGLKALMGIIEFGVSSINENTPPTLKERILNVRESILTGIKKDYYSNPTALSLRRLVYMTRYLPPTHTPLLARLLASSVLSSTSSNVNASPASKQIMYSTCK